MSMPGKNNGRVWGPTERAPIQKSCVIRNETFESYR